MFARFSAIIMILSLLWLTVSLPFVYESMNEPDLITENSGSSELPEDEEVPLNTTEEKSPVNSFPQEEEYLHHFDENLELASQFLSHNCKHHEKVYVAFHGELLSPPPESLS